MLVKTKGVVVKSVNVGEYDRMITAITEDRGKIAFKVCGANSMKNKNTSSCNMFTYSEFVLRQKGEHYTLDKGSSIHYPFRSSCDIDSVSLAAYLCQLCADTSIDEESCRDIQRLLVNALFIIAKKDRPTDFIKGVFELRLLSRLGLKPLNDCCCNCRKSRKLFKKMYFDPVGGDLLCPDCRLDGRIELSAECVELMWGACEKEESKAYAVDVSPALLKEFSFAAESFLLNQLEKKYHTLDYYKSIKS